MVKGRMVTLGRRTEAKAQRKGEIERQEKRQTQRDSKKEQGRVGWGHRESDTGGALRDRVLEKVNEPPVISCLACVRAECVARPSVPVQLGAGRVLGLFLVEVPLLLIPGHDIQVVEVRVVVHGAAGERGVRGHSALRPLRPSHMLVAVSPS